MWYVRYKSTRQWFHSFLSKPEVVSGFQNRKLFLCHNIQEQSPLLYHHRVALELAVLPEVSLCEIFSNLTTNFALAWHYSLYFSSHVSCVHGGEFQPISEDPTNPIFLTRCAKDKRLLTKKKKRTDWGEWTRSFVFKIQSVHLRAIRFRKRSVNSPCEMYIFNIQ